MFLCDQIHHHIDAQANENNSKPQPPFAMVKEVSDFLPNGVVLLFLLLFVNGLTFGNYALLQAHQFNPLFPNLLCIGFLFRLFLLFQQFLLFDFPFFFCLPFPCINFPNGFQKSLFFFLLFLFGAGFFRFLLLFFRFLQAGTSRFLLLL